MIILITYFLEKIALYFGMTSIRCMIEGNCYSKVIWIFILYYNSTFINIFIVKKYFPKLMKKIKKIHEIVKNIKEF